MPTRTRYLLVLPNLPAAVRASWSPAVPVPPDAPLLDPHRRDERPQPVNEIDSRFGSLSRALMIRHADSTLRVGAPTRSHTTRSSHDHVRPTPRRTLAADLTYEEVLSGETHHAAFFRLQIEDTVVNGMDYALLDADGKIAEVSSCPSPSQPTLWA